MGNKNLAEMSFKEAQAAQAFFHEEEAYEAYRKERESKTRRFKKLHNDRKHRRAR